MKMINPQDKKILVIAGVCISLIFLFWAFIYFPANNKLRLLKTEFNSISNEIAAIECHGGKGGHDIAAMVVAIQNDFKTAMQRFPSGEEEALKFFSSEANRLGIEVVSMRQEPKRPFLDMNNNPVFLEDKQCFEIPISIEMKGLYKAVGEYLKVLREGSKVLIKVEDIKIQKDETIAPRLKVNLQLTLCLACKV